MELDCLTFDEPNKRPNVAATKEGSIEFYAVPGQLLITGDNDDIGAVISHLDTQGFKVTSHGDVARTESGPIFTIDDIFSIDGSPSSGFTIHLYEFHREDDDSPLNPWKLMDIANTFVLNNRPLFAIAEVNEILHGLMHSAGGGVHGGPTGETIDINGVDLPDAAFFKTQWAFQTDTGINLFKGEEYIDKEARGKGVHVAVFDSSPLGTGYYDTKTLTGGYPFKLCVTAALDDLIGDETARDRYTEHGYFSASLIHAVAPECEIHLVQVLDDHVHGSVGFLLSMMDKYIDAFKEKHPIDTHPRLILNLSLGFKLNSRKALEILEDKVILKSAKEAVKNLRQVSETISGERKNKETKGERERDPIAGLLDQLTGGSDIPHVAHGFYMNNLSRRHADLSHLVVAAAGNEGVKERRRPKATMPASFDSVLGVAASGKKGRLALFANDAVVMAPGGDFGLNPPDASDLDSADWIDDLDVLCVYPINCPYAITGRATTDEIIALDGAQIREKAHDMNSGYMLWWGSSFSAPLAAGLAALVWGVDPTLPPPDVRKFIIENANKRVDDAGEVGIINVIHTLEAVRDDQNPGGGD